MSRPKGTKMCRRVREIAYAYHRALNGGITEPLTGKETLGSTHGRFALSVAQELGLKTVPAFTARTTLAEAIQRFTELLRG